TCAILVQRARACKTRSQVESAAITIPVEQPCFECGPTAFDVREVEQLWTFLDGAMMKPDVRHLLWRSWGFCPRHSWAHAIVELELRGARPFATTILWEDLLRRAATSLGQRPGALAVRRLRPRSECFTCRYVLAARPGGRRG